MTAASRSRQWSLCAGALVLVYAACVAIARSAAFAHAPAALSTGISLDLTGTAALLIYWLGVRPGALPKLALVPVLAGGLALAHWLVPPDHRAALRLLGYGWAVVELGLTAIVIAKLRSIVRDTRAARAAGSPLPRALDTSLARALGLPWAASAIAQEVCALWYGLTGWFRRAPRSPFRDRDIGAWGAIVAVLALLTVTEGGGLHLALEEWSVPAAAIGAVLHIYTLLWLLGDWHSVRHGPPRRDRDTLRVDLGFRLRADIPLAAIAEVTAGGGATPAGDGYLRAHLLFSPNVVIRLRAPETATMMFGRRRDFDAIGLAVADPDAVVRELDRR